MAITHKIIVTSFVRGQGVLDISARYQVPIATVENAVRLHLKRDFYSIPEQLTLEQKPEQLTLSERYGEITI